MGREYALTTGRFRAMHSTSGLTQPVKVYSLPALGHTNVTMRLRLLAGGE